MTMRRVSTRLFGLTCGVLGLLGFSAGCATTPDRVRPMEYSVDNPYAPGGVLYESWEDKRSRDGALGSSKVKGAAVGAAGGAVLGQIVGRNSRNTLKAAAVGAIGGLVIGSAEDKKLRVEHENRVTRQANQWQGKRNREDQAQRDVDLGGSITEAQKQNAMKRLEAAKAALAQRDRDAQSARQMREIEAEIARLNATTTSRSAP